MKNEKTIHHLLSVIGLLQRMLPSISAEEKLKKTKESDGFAEQISDLIKQSDALISELKEDISEEVNEIEKGKLRKEFDELSIKYFELRVKLDVLFNRKTAVEISMKTKKEQRLVSQIFGENDSVDTKKLLDYLFSDVSKQK